MGTETGFVLLFVVATAVAIGARRFRLPYTVALVLAGLALGIVHLFEPPHLTKELLYAVFLPGLLFEAAFHLEFRDFWRDRMAIAALAVPGVAAAIALTAVILEPIIKTFELGTSFGWPHAVVFGALIAATDPIAVVGMFKTLGAPRRLSILIEGESLLNDGTAIVLFALALDVVSGSRVSRRGAGGGVRADRGRRTRRGPPRRARDLADHPADRRSDDRDHADHDRGVRVVPRRGAVRLVGRDRDGHGRHAVRQLRGAHRHVALHAHRRRDVLGIHRLRAQLDCLPARRAARAHRRAGAVVGAHPRRVRRGDARARGGGVRGVGAQPGEAAATAWPASWSAVLTWGGLRGSLSMVLALALPPALAQRDLLVTVTFGVVLLSILLQGLTMGPLLRKLGVVRHHEARQKYQLKRGELRMTQAALGEIGRMEQLHVAPSAILRDLREEYEERARDVTATVEALRLEQDDLRAEEAALARRRVLLAEKEEVLADFHRGTLSAEAYDALLGTIDARLATLDAEPASNDRASETPPKIKLN